jgi:membrane-associated phospholipid phosphatase
LRTFHLTSRSSEKVLLKRICPSGRRIEHSTRWKTVLLLGVLFSPAGSMADSFSLGELLNDTKLYYTAPLRWDAQDWLYFGAALTAIGAAHEFDSRVRTHFVNPKDPLNGDDRNSARDALPALALIVGTGLYAGAIGDRDGYRETWSLLEAGVFSVTTSEVLTLAAGRERPDATTSANLWRHGGDSFPSVHVSAAFAIGTVFAESGNDEYRWVRRILGYGIAAATSYVRVRENVHWLSDTVAGTALGIATARFVLNRRDREQRAALQFQPVKDGWQLAYTVRTR